ncbi:MAG: hypothetical protein KAI47_28455, partial [Deltaproteobacteria bacterium]|nr:hypothetical protein [Deltaproteobacteria bacterium]
SPASSPASQRRRVPSSLPSPRSSRAPHGRHREAASATPPDRRQRPGSELGVFRFDALRIEGLAGPNALILRQLLAARRRSLVRRRRSFVHRIFATLEVRSP